MERWIALLVLVGWAGGSLMLAETRWATPRAWVDRCRPYVPGGWRIEGHDGPFGTGSLSAVLAPIAASVGQTLSRWLGVREELELRLQRLHREDDASQFRTRQVGTAVLAFGGASLVALAARPAPSLALLLVLGAPALAFLVLEHGLSRASAERQAQLVRELPIVCEQLGMLLSAGRSLGAAIDHVARRRTGPCAEDLRRISARVAQGLDLAAALAEWAVISGLPEIERLVTTLALDRDTADLGDLVAQESRALRQQAHRDLLTEIDRRSQQVWIPVTVATLVPGTIFLAVPFLDALRLFSQS